MAATKQTRKVANREKLAVERQIILPDDVTVIREADVVGWIIDGQHSVANAAKHFDVSTGVIRRILNDAGVKPAEQLTVWSRPDEQAVEPEESVEALKPE